MKSPLIYASRCLSDMEDRWIPYSSLWWRFWTPRIPRGERYQEGAFTGYLNDDDDDDEDPSNMALLDIRRMLAIPLIRRIYEKLPYIDVTPITRPYEQMTPTQRDQRNTFVIESTLAAYTSGKALYPRSTIARIEAQLTAAGTTLARRREDPHHRRRNPFKRLGRGLRHKLFSHCEAPQTAFLSFPAYDNITTHVSTWSPGAELAFADPLSDDSDSDNDNDSDADDAAPRVYRPARSQIEFRTIQELTQPDPGNAEEQFAPDSWMTAVGYQPVMLVAELRGETAATMPIYMPAFEIVRRWNPAEREFLQSNGVEFVESNGEMFLKVDERTVVVSYRNWNPVKQVVADIAKPAALICTPVSDDPEQDFAWKDEQAGDSDDEETIRVPVVRSRLVNSYSMVADPDSPRVRKLVEDYDAFELPELPGELPTETEGKETLKLYMRKPDASTNVEYW
ncbi:hypothetical protein F5144DRAFT_547249 [Chaetomium tenue]|uniref:Uncharacterized protein n=1 Tax=Chaetomium tenue TaxID=1854479 RepID=A0ACB7PIU0_9PEZI|nr:hypothetical protein F5144DRAFT_547249 [Chaetomium globosum]